MTVVLDIDDPDFLSCPHFSSGQQVFCNLEFAALLFFFFFSQALNFLVESFVLCLTVTEYKYIPYKRNTILPDSRKTVIYDTSMLKRLKNTSRNERVTLQVYGTCQQMCDFFGLRRRDCLTRSTLSFDTRGHLALFPLQRHPAV